MERCWKNYSNDDEINIKKKYHLYLIGKRLDRNLFKKKLRFLLLDPYRNSSDKWLNIPAISLCYLIRYLCFSNFYTYIIFECSNSELFNLHLMMMTHFFVKFRGHVELLTLFGLHSTDEKVKFRQHGNINECKAGLTREITNAAHRKLQQGDRVPNYANDSHDYCKNEAITVSDNSGPELKRALFQSFWTRAVEWV